MTTPTTCTLNGKTYTLTTGTSICTGCVAESPTSEPTKLCIELGDCMTFNGAPFEGIWVEADEAPVTEGEQSPYRWQYHLTPTRQLPARELIKRNILIPYFHPSERDDEPVHYHLTVVVLDDWELETLTIAARKHAAALIPNVSDNRTNLDYPACPREVLAFIRHMLINRTANNLGQSSGYQNGYDNILHKIQKKGVDVAARQLAFKRHVGALIAASYPHLADEVAYWLWQVETNQQRKGAGQ